MPPAHREPSLTTSAQLAKPDRSQESHQWQASGERIDEFQHHVSERKPGRKECDDRIDDADEQKIGGHGTEVIKASRQCVCEVRQADPTDARIGNARSFAGYHVKVRHRTPPNRWPTDRSLDADPVGLDIPK